MSSAEVSSEDEEGHSSRELFSGLEDSGMMHRNESEMS